LQWARRITCTRELKQNQWHFPWGVRDEKNSEPCSHVDQGRQAILLRKQMWLLIWGNWKDYYRQDSQQDYKRNEGRQKWPKKGWMVGERGGKVQVPWESGSRGRQCQGVQRVWVHKKKGERGDARKKKKVVHRRKAKKRKSAVKAAKKTKKARKGHLRPPRVF